jgi:hypothetical protein
MRILDQLIVGRSGSTAKLFVEIDATGTPGVVIRAAAGQVANLLDIQNSSGASLLTIDKDGKITNGVITGGSIDNVIIGGTTPAAGTFTTLSSTGFSWTPASRELRLALAYRDRRANANARLNRSERRKRRCRRPQQRNQLDRHRNSIETV